MSIMSSTKLSAQIRSIKGNSKNLREQIQEALISCAYYAAKDGNTNPFNQLLEAVGTATRIKGLTAWAEYWGFVQVQKEKFILNKSARKEANVTDESSFASFEADMRAAPMWFDIVPAEKATSIFDATAYLEGVLKTLEKQGANDAKFFLQEAVNKYKAADALIKLQLESLGEALL